MKKILITGAKGFIGRNLTEQLEGDYRISTPGHKELDLLNRQQVQSFLAEHKFDVVIHSATHNATITSHVDKNLVLQNNLAMFSNLAENADCFGRMIYFGSGAEYNRQTMPPKVPEDYFGKSQPEDGYALSKYQNQLVAEKSKNIYNLTLFGCFGKYEDYRIRFISNMICKAIYGLPLTMNQNAVFDYLYINDLVNIVRKFIEAGNLNFHKYNVCTGQGMELVALAKSVLKVTGKNLEINIAQEGLGKEYSGDNSRLLEEFPDVSFTPTETAVKELADWYEVNKSQIQKNQLFANK